MFKRGEGYQPAQKKQERAIGKDQSKRHLRRPAVQKKAWNKPSQWAGVPTASTEGLEGLTESIPILMMKNTNKKKKRRERCSQLPALVGGKAAPEEMKKKEKGDQQQQRLVRKRYITWSRHAEVLGHGVPKLKCFVASQQRRSKVGQTQQQRIALPIPPKEGGGGGWHNRPGRRDRKKTKEPAMKKEGRVAGAEQSRMWRAWEVTGPTRLKMCKTSRPRAWWGEGENWH